MGHEFRSRSITLSPVFNRIIFSIGSLSVGAALVMGLMHVTSMLSVAIAGGMIMAALYVCYFVRRMSVRPVRVAYHADTEAERYTDADVRELFERLAEAKAKSANPFHSRYSDY